MQKIGFIGAGNIALAIVKGAILSNTVNPKDITVFDIDLGKLSPFIELGATPAQSVKELAENANTIFLTVKPQVLEGVAQSLSPHLKKGTLIISPIAGAKIKRISALLGGYEKIIRVMPNTPLTFGAGATALTRGEDVTAAEFDFANKIFASSGITAQLDESLLDTVTGVSGSSPAFFMRFAREIINEGVRQGLDYDTAKSLVLGTMAGTAKMALQSEKELDELIKAVASPGGTTEAGLNKMTECDFDKTTAEVIKAAINRSKQL